MNRCTAHCDSMWYCRTRPGIIQGFATAIGTPDLTAAFDRMSINLPTTSGNPVTLERAAQSFEHGKFGVMQTMHTHKNSYYNKLNETQTGEPEYTDYYGIVPLWDMSASSETRSLTLRLKLSLTIRTMCTTLGAQTRPRARQLWFPEATSSYLKSMPSVSREGMSMANT